MQRSFPAVSTQQSQNFCPSPFPWGRHCPPRLCQKRTPCWLLEEEKEALPFAVLLFDFKQLAGEILGLMSPPLALGRVTERLCRAARVTQESHWSSVILQITSYFTLSVTDSLTAETLPPIRRQDVSFLLAPFACTSWEVFGKKKKSKFSFLFLFFPIKTGRGSRYEQTIIEPRDLGVLSEHLLWAWHWAKFHRPGSEDYKEPPACRPQAGPVLCEGQRGLRAHDRASALTDWEMLKSGFSRQNKRFTEMERLQTTNSDHIPTNRFGLVSV